MREYSAVKLSSLFVAIVLVLSGCTSTYKFKVDAIKNPEIDQNIQSYKLVSSNRTVNEEDLQFKEVAKYVKTALSGKGMYEAPTAEKADVIIDVSYGLGEPTIDFKTYSVPVYEMVGGGSRPVRVAVYNEKGKIVGYRTQYVYTPPRKELVGTEQKVIPITTYEKFLRMTAKENREVTEFEGPVQAWSIYVKNKDESDDLRKYLPLMAAASIDYVGQSTDSQQEIKIKDTDETVVFVKKGF